MLLAIDVGNTNITVGVFRGRRLVAEGRMSTHGSRTSAGYTVVLRNLLRKLKSSPIDGVILSSVVPKATPKLVAALRRLNLPNPWVLGRNVKAPIINRYRIPSQVGQDRLVNAVAAFHLYGAPAIVVDFGTAITIDLVSKRKEYLGGLIVPGIEISLDNLSDRAALLPKIKLAPPRGNELLGRDTVSSMRKGIFFGYSALCDGIVRELKRQHAPKARVIATGGHATLMAPLCRTIQVINPQLTLQGLELIYRDASRSVPIFKKTVDK